MVGAVRKALVGLEWVIGSVPLHLSLPILPSLSVSSFPAAPCAFAQGPLASVLSHVSLQPAACTAAVPASSRGSPKR